MNRFPVRVFAALLVLPVTCLAQLSSERQVLAASGQHLTGGTLDVSFTLGECTTGPLQPSGSPLTANLGFQQGDLMISSLDEWLASGLPALFPNPFHEEIFLSNPSNRSGTLQILDPLGRLVLLKQVLPHSPSESIRLASHPAGAYLVRFQDHSQPNASFLTILKQ